jgi:hypothetical protein
LNTLTISLLVSSVVAFPIPSVEVTDTYAVDMTCTRCTASQNQWCSLTADFGPYKELATGVTIPANAVSNADTMQCCEAGTPCTWDDGTHPVEADFTCTDPTDTPYLQLASCPFQVDVCSATRAYSFAVGTAPDVAETATASIVALTGETSCTYQIVATVGAPGFSLDNTVTATSTTVVSWTEYSAVVADGFTEFAASSLYPALTMPTSDINCGSHCPQGEWIARVDGTSNVSAY